MSARPTTSTEGCDCTRCRNGRSHQELADRIKWASRIVNNGVMAHLEAGDTTGPEDLALIAKLADEANEALGQAVRVMREVQGYSWAHVGSALGVTRQAAQMRFAKYMTATK